MQIPATRLFTTNANKMSWLNKLHSSGDHQYATTSPTNLGQDQQLANNSVVPLSVQHPSYFIQRQLEEQKVQAVFMHKFNQLKQHAALGHPLFKQMTQLAKTGQLSPQQVDVFTTFMLARIHLTMASIAKQAAFALENADYPLFVTAYQNLKEKGADGVIEKMHPMLAQHAFNAVRRSYSLPPITMKEAFDHAKATCSSMKNYADTVSELYHTDPVFASLAQEAASGGDGMTGMMADLYAFFSALESRIGASTFKAVVLPYFSDHLTQNPDGSFRDDVTTDIECQHGQRAIDDALRYVTNEEDVNGAILVMSEFANVQEQLFSTLGQQVQRHRFSIIE